MKIDLYLTPGELPPAHTKGRRVVIIDVLRSCTSLAFALAAGAERIVPAETVEGAKKLLALLDRESTLLAGEQEGVKLPGFDLGNSPGEYRQAQLAGMTLVFISSDGSPLMARMYDEVEKPLLSFVNMQAVTDYLLAMNDPELAVLCAGHGGRFALEDAVCAGMLCHRLSSEEGRELNDAAHAALLLHDQHKADLSGLLASCAHGRFLAENGLAADLVEAAAVDSISVVPVVKEGRVTVARGAGGGRVTRQRP